MASKGKPPKKTVVIAIIVIIIRIIITITIIIVIIVKMKNAEDLKLVAIVCIYVIIN